MKNKNYEQAYKSTKTRPLKVINISRNLHFFVISPTFHKQNQTTIAATKPKELRHFSYYSYVDMLKSFALDESNA